MGFVNLVSFCCILKVFVGCLEISGDLEEFSGRGGEDAYSDFFDKYYAGGPRFTAPGFDDEDDGRYMDGGSGDGFDYDSSGEVFDEDILTATTTTITTATTISTTVKTTTDNYIVFVDFEDIGSGEEPSGAHVDEETGEDVTRVTTTIIPKMIDNGDFELDEEEEIATTPREEDDLNQFGPNDDPTYLYGYHLLVIVLYSILIVLLAGCILIALCVIGARRFKQKRYGVNGDGLSSSDSTASSDLPFIKKNRQLTINTNPYYGGPSNRSHYGRQSSLSPPPLPDLSLPPEGKSEKSRCALNCFNSNQDKGNVKCTNSTVNKNKQKQTNWL